jgi:hypothetical protein
VSEYSGLTMLGRLNLARSLGVAAIREAYEESGLCVGDLVVKGMNDGV